jgi:LacI family transcriptional regulator
MEGVIAALREREDRRGLVAVCNELTPDSRLALSEGILSMAIATPLQALSTELIRVMALACMPKIQDLPGQSFLPFNLHLPENI